MVQDLEVIKNDSVISELKQKSKKFSNPVPLECLGVPIHDDSFQSQWPRRTTRTLLNRSVELGKEATLSQQKQRETRLRVQTTAKHQEMLFSFYGCTQVQ